MNRIATAMLAIGRVTPWETDPRPLASSQVGSTVAQHALPSWRDMPVSALAGYAAGAAIEDMAADQLPSSEIMATSPEHWVKDATSVLLAIRLAALQPAIASLISAGEGQLLLDALKSQVGYWDADHASRIAAPLIQSPVSFAEVMQGRVVPVSSWRIPSDGVGGPVILPCLGGEQGVLLIDSCSMDYLPDLQRAVAVIAYKGSVTSHLMQHAAAMKLPVVIGAELPQGLAIGSQVMISGHGEVTRA